MQSVPSPAKVPEPAVDEGTAQRMAAALLSYSAIEVRGGWPTVPASAKLAPGGSGPEVACCASGSSSPTILRPSRSAARSMTQRVAAAVRRFQARHGLEETGTVGPKTLAALNVPVGKRLRQLAASLDRLSAMDFQFGQRYVVVNLPAAFAEAVVGNKVVRRHVVQVGRPDRPSPTLTTYITTVNLNPTWTVPLGILKKDVIPKMRKDPGYAARMHMRVLDGAGNEVDPHSVDWNSDRAPNFTIRQDSGTWNALGAVRIDMPNPHSVYMHDTNHKEFFSADYRFQSSGCTRVENPRDLAAWVLEETPGWSRREIDAAIAKGQKRRRPCRPQDPGGLDLSHRLGDARRRHSFPRRHLRPRREARARRRAQALDGDRLACLGLHPAVGRHQSCRFEAGVVPRQPVGRTC